MTTLISNIKILGGIAEKSQLLRGKSLAQFNSIENAYLVIEDDRISAYGKMTELFDPKKQFSTIIDAQDQTILPAWCDSHTHLVFAGSREAEFVDKINGLSYAEIAAKGGGILNSSAKIHASSESELYDGAKERIQELMKLGTGAVEIKSGYGLSIEDEIKMLRVIKKLKRYSAIPIKGSFLGAHTYSKKYKEDHEGYLKLIIEEMLPIIVNEKLADYIDVFCEDGFFSVKETDRILKAGIAVGLKPKIHANQLNISGGVQIGVANNAISVDHLESMDEAAISSLSASSTIGTMLPTAAYFLRMSYPPARKMIDAGCALALASDFNPGSSPSGNMNQVVSMACIQMKMLPEEAINAATINGAFAMELQNEVGSISIGKKANLIFTKPIPSIAYLPYSFGSNLIDKVMINGNIIN